MFFHYYIDSNTLHYKVFPYFEIDSSWLRYKQGKIAEYVLLHEQGHFDLNELYARRIRRYFNKLTLSHAKDSTIMVDCTNFFRESNLLNEVYDQQTNANKEDALTNMKAQYKWSIQIKRMLDSLINYESIESTIILK